MSARTPRLEVEGLQKRFGGLTAVKDVSFSVHAGEILGLIGPNGSGKSTVMKSILGVERPDAGSVRVDGREVAGWPPHRIARLGVGMVFQHSRPLYRQTVLENIMLGLLPDRLLDVLPRRRHRRAGARDRRARRTGRRARPAPRDAAVRGLAQNRDRQGDRPRSAGGADRRAVRGPDRARDRVVRRR